MSTAGDELDREQREAVRHEIATTSNGYGDFEFAIQDGDRAWVIEHLERLQGMLAVMDAIGWTEQDDAPDRQPVHATSRARQWAATNAAELAVAMTQSGPVDMDLIALGALHRIAGETS